MPLSLIDLDLTNEIYRPTLEKYKFLGIVLRPDI